MGAVVVVVHDHLPCTTVVNVNLKFRGDTLILDVQISNVNCCAVSFFMLKHFQLCLDNFVYKSNLLFKKKVN